MPGPGTITRLRLPQGPGVRDDGGVYEGCEVSIYYDPMISKLAVYGKDRSEAIDRMRRALAEYEVGGIKTTLAFFREVMNDAVFIEGNLDTGFITGFNERKKAVEPDEATRDMAAIAAAIASKQKQKSVQTSVGNGNVKLSAWGTAGRQAAFRTRL